MNIIIEIDKLIF